MPLAASIRATFGPTPRTYITGVSRVGTIECYSPPAIKSEHNR
jgi:hypothetical protein